MKKKGKTSRMWGGAFSAGPRESLKKLNDSFSFDRELLAEDVEGSLAWAGELVEAGVLTKPEYSVIARGLMAILDSALQKGMPSDGYEDVHSFVESTLADKIGPVAGKLHTGRSRNDQVATDFRLYVKKAFTEATGAIAELAWELTAKAQAEAATPMPGYTHLKRAIPVTFGHWCLAYANMLDRDLSRFADAADRADECPLGSGALAGTPIGVNRERLAKTLGFSRASLNSLDAVSDRDFAAEYLFCSALLQVHLSRMAEDLIIFSSDEFGFVRLPDGLATGSSRMPHKKNPDLLELARGHAGRAIGELAGLLAVLKGLPMAYDKDLQLDKEPVFRTRAALSAILTAMTELVSRLELDRKAMLEAASDDRMAATDLADALVRRGIPFRKAHEMVGERVLKAAVQGRSIRELGEGGGITAADLMAMDIGGVLERRGNLGGTSPIMVRRAAAKLAKKIGKIRRP